METFVNKKDKYRELLIYVLSRTFIVFFVKLLLGIIKFNNAKFEMFFESFSVSFWEALFGLVVILMTIILIAIFINLIFTILRLADNKGEIINYLKQYGFWDNVRQFINNFFPLLKKNAKYEWNRDKVKYMYSMNPKKDSLLYEYKNKDTNNRNDSCERDTKKRCKLTNQFIIIAIFSVLFFKGNPFLNKFYGVYNSFVSGITREGDETFGEECLLMIEKNDWNEEDLQWSYFKNNYLIYIYDNYDIMDYNDLNEYDKGFYNEIDIRKRGYVFKEAGAFDGFNVKHLNDGFLSYFKCLTFYIIEKIIITVIYFLIPFLISILYIYLKTPKQKYLYMLSILVVFPALLHFEFFGDVLQTSIPTTLIFIAISLVNLLPLMPMCFKGRSLWRKSELIKITLWVTIIIILSYVAFEIYNKFWARGLLLFPILLWWGVVLLLRYVLREEVTSNEKPSIG